MRHALRSTALLFTALTLGPVQAQGIPVIDAANLVQTVQQVVNDITQINNQVQQIVHLQHQLQAMTGSRHLGSVFNNPALQNYVPAQAHRQIDAVAAQGYAGLTGRGRALRDAGMVYNCMDLAGTARTNCQALLAQPYQHRGLLQDAMRAATGRLGQIQALMGQIDATTDPKSVQEIQARIGAENALLAHETSQLQMLQSLSDNDDRVARARDRERQYEALTRTGKVADHLPR